MQETSTSSFLEKNLIVGEFVLDYRLGTLSKADVRHKLEPLAFEFLRLLIDHHREVVSREMLLSMLWQNRCVSDDAIRSVVRKLRICLRDDARSPSYIKTIPLKGYMLIAPISEVPESVQKATHTFWSLLRAMVATTFLVSLALLASFLMLRQAPEKEPSARVERLTSMSGSELSPDFSRALNALVFSHRGNNDEPMQLYVKNLNTQRLLRLTWDRASYFNAHWSADGRQIMYSRRNTEGVATLLANFDPRTGITTQQLLDPEVLGPKFLLGWSASGDSAYFTDTYRATSPQGIYRFDLNSNQLHRLTAPSVEGVGDFFARESHDGHSLAILRGASANRVELLVLDVKSEALLVHRLFPHPVNRLIWASDDQQLFLSSFTGGVYQYNLKRNKISTLHGTHAFINQVFYQCGDHCYFMREHNGNFLDIQEQPNPFEAQTIRSADYFNLPTADDLPTYNASGSRIYFASLAADALLLRRQGKHSPLEEITRFDKYSNLSMIAVSPDETSLLVAIDKHISVIAISTGKTTFTSSELQDIRNPSWHPDGHSIVFTRVESGIPNVYRLQLETKQIKRIAQGFVSYRFLTSGDRVAVDQRFDVYLLKDKANPRLITRLHSNDPQRWRVVGNDFYYTSQVGFGSFMTRVNLTTGNEETRQIGKNRFRQSFDVHPEGDRVAIVESLLAESNLVKVVLP